MKKIALVGNPNVGKSSIFNNLTKGKEHVGNWPGKTIEKKEGRMRYRGRDYYIIDLPGTYSMNYYTEEERITRDYILKEKPDIIIDVVDAFSLERNLYLTLQLLEMTDNVILVVNKIDVAHKAGMDIDVNALRKMLNIPVVVTNAKTRDGMEELLNVIYNFKPESRADIKYDRSVEEHIEMIERNMLYSGSMKKRWVAIKLIEDDEEIIKHAMKYIENWNEIKKLIENMKVRHKGMSMEIELIRKRYELIENIVSKTVRVGRKERLNEKMDRILTDAKLGVPIVFAIYGAVFWLTYTLSAPLSGYIDNFFSWLSEAITTYLDFYNIPEMFKSLIVDGVLSGVGGVMVFFPLIFIFYFVFSFFEDSGYMARSSVAIDRFMRFAGLNGRAFLPLLMGYGCNVTGILATRTIKEKRERVIAILLNSLVPCSARLGIMMFMVGAFFTGIYAAFVMLSLILINLMLIMIIGFVFSRHILGKNPAPLIIELPPYTMPRLKDMFMHAWWRSKIFIKKVATVIVLFSIIMWFLTYFPSGSIETSIAARIGRLLEPAGRFMGFDWRVIVALISGFAAKENVISTLSILYSSNGESLMHALQTAMTSLVAFVFLLVQMIYVPCVSTLAVMSQELKNRKLTIIGILYPLLLAFLIGGVVYAIGSVVGL